MPLIDLVTKLADAADFPDPLSATARVLRDQADRVGEILEQLAFLSGLGSDPEQSFYRSPAVSLLKVTFAPGAPTPPHDHGTWAAILLLDGAERNIVYRRESDAIRAHLDVTLRPGDVLPMAADAIHVAECASAEPAIGLHVYGGDLPAIPRSVWNPQTLEEHPHSEPTYAAFKALAGMAVAGFSGSVS